MHNIVKDRPHIDLCRHYFCLVVICVLIIGCWQISALIFVDSPIFIVLPSPAKIWLSFINDFNNIIYHSVTTLQEATYGIFFSILIGVSLAIMMDYLPKFAKIIYPFLVFTQTVPIIALAPLFFIIFGADIFPKILIIVLWCFYPICINLYAGFNMIDSDIIKLCNSMRASYLQQLILIKIPAALESLFTGLKIAISYAIIAAVTSEWIGGFSGLGVYMLRVKKTFSYDKMFAVILWISLLSILLTGMVSLLAKYLIKWKRVS